MQRGRFLTTRELLRIVCCWLVVDSKGFYWQGSLNPQQNWLFADNFYSEIEQRVTYLSGIFTDENKLAAFTKSSGETNWRENITINNKNVLTKEKKCASVKLAESCGIPVAISLIH